jgi:hypothetical protein
MAKKMYPSELLRELHESNARLKAIIQVLRERLRDHDRPLTATERDELNWLARDYDDEKNGDWTR